MQFSSIDSAIEDIINGKAIIVVDSEDRENEGDLVIASELVTPDAINFMAKEGRGMICVSITNERAKALDLMPIERKYTGLHETNFTTSVDARKNTTTGISAFDRSETVRALIDDKTVAEDLSRPGHIFPIVGKKGGVFDFASANELWRASIETLDFVPLINASYSGGIIITDWFNGGKDNNRDLKITVRFLSNEIRSEADLINIC